MQFIALDPNATGDLYASDPNDQLWLGRQQIPGICSVTISQEFKSDPRSPNGLSGEALTSSATKAAEGQIQIRIWTQEHHDRMAMLWPILWPSKDGQTMYALAIESVVTGLARIGVVGLNKLVGIVAEDKIRVITFGWRQLRKGKKRVVAEPKDYAGGASGSGIPNAPAAPAKTKPSAGRAVTP